MNSVHDQPGYPLFTADCNGREWGIYSINTMGVSLICLGIATAVSMLIGLVYVLMNKQIAYYYFILHNYNTLLWHGLLAMRIK